MLPTRRGSDPHHSVRDEAVSDAYAVRLYGDFHTVVAALLRVGRLHPSLRAALSASTDLGRCDRAEHGSRVALRQKQAQRAPAGCAVCTVRNHGASFLSTETARKLGGVFPWYSSHQWALRPLAILGQSIDGRRVLALVNALQATLPLLLILKRPASMFEIAVWSAPSKVAAVGADMPADSRNRRSSVPNRRLRVVCANLGARATSGCSRLTASPAASN